MNMLNMCVGDTRCMAESNIGASIESGLRFSCFVFVGQG
jgi:hypothetical protein